VIFATCGGGTGLPTRCQCLELLGCFSSGKADKLAEICAAVALAARHLAGVGGDPRQAGCPAHERLGRNRP
jgi:hydroxymethylglutaryl-CoA reductase (NADPH)